VITVLMPATSVYSIILMEGITEESALYMLIGDGVSYFIRGKILGMCANVFIALMLSEVRMVREYSEIPLRNQSVL